MVAEDYAIVLDYLAKGKSTSFKSEPLAQLIGTKYFTLLEVVPKADLKASDEVYIGKETRDKIDYIKRRISYKELTNNSISELEKVLEDIVKKNEQKFVDFFNNSNPITLKRHQLELLPGLGKKHLFNILDERRNEPFKSYADLEKRVHLMPNPVKIIVKRILQELEEMDDKHYLFVRPPSHQDEHAERRDERGFKEFKHNPLPEFRPTVKSQ